jgi:hypothetical protein
MVGVTTTKTAQIGHLGLRLPLEVIEKLKALIEREQKRVGPLVKVTSTYMIGSLILAEYDRQATAKKAAKNAKPE